MTQPHRLRIHLPEGLRASAEAGRHNFLRQVVEVVGEAGFLVEFLPDTPVERSKTVTQGRYALYHMADPAHDSGLTFRRVYHYPFWAIERSGRRWEWNIAQAPFPEGSRHRDADRFARHWAQQLFGDAPVKARRDGLVYVPLQGHLLRHRSFQARSPIEMVEHVLANDASRRIVATLHPKEIYTPEELSALESLASRFPRLTVSTGDMERWLGLCDYVVTQNSSAAFNGFFFGKPAVLFGRIDFHHIAANVHRMGVEEALRAGPDLAPDYPAYLHWFWQQMSINAGRPEAKDRIREALRRGGWPV